MKRYIYSLLVGVMALLVGCTPDEYELGKQTYMSDDLAQGIAYSVAINGNLVTLKSNISDCTPLWITPQGRSQATELSLELPFAGTYEVTFGVETPGGVVYGDPYTFQLNQNDFSMLSDEKWFLLADKNFKSGDALPDAETLTKGISKKWYPCDANYGIGRCSGPVMYMSPDDVANDGSGSTDLKFGSANWAPNWDPGFQSWLIPATDPYMDSYMTFSMDAAGGCVATMYRGESGERFNSTGTQMTGKFNLTLSDKDRPTISFSDCYSMHNVGFDAVCSNYTQDIKILELTPYLFQVATMRTNSEGPWWIVWNFVSEEVIATGGQCIPKEESGEIEKVAPQLPVIDNVVEKLFTTEINGVTYVGNQMKFNLDTEVPYDWMWWNGSPSVQAWESVTGGVYNSTWAPAPGEEVEDFELILSKRSDGTIAYEYGEVSGTVAITSDENGVSLLFSEGLNILTASNDFCTVNLQGTAFNLLGIEPGETLQLGVADGSDEQGEPNRYLVGNLTYKKISTGEEGPTVVGIDNSTIAEHTWIENGCIRVGFHHYGEGGTGIFKDAASVKLKKNQTISVTFRINGGITWSATPKCALIDNNIKTTWEPDCFDLDDAVTVNLGGETTVSLTNTTGASVTFIPSCLDLSIQYDGFGVADVLAEDGNPDWTTVGLEIVSCTIQ